MNNVSGNSLIISFDNFFVSNYSYLKEFCKSINPRADFENLLHEVYLKCRERIMLSAYTGTTYLNYVRVACMNQYKNLIKTKSSNYLLKHINIEDVNFINNIESKLQEESYFQDQQHTYDDRVSYINTMIFQYVDQYYDKKSNYLFKTYYLLKRKHLTYKQLSTITGIGINEITNIILNIKKDLKLNLLNYILQES